MTVAEVTAISVYPVKGEPGRRLDEAAVDTEGLTGDRRKKAAVHLVAEADDAPHLRANLVVSLTPVELAAAIGGSVLAGGVELEVIGTARDCPGVYAAVRRPGLVRLGDAVTAVPPQQEGTSTDQVDAVVEPGA